MTSTSTLSSVSRASAERPVTRRILLAISLAAISIAIIEAFAYAVLALASRVLTEPPTRTTTILREQSKAVRTLLANDPNRRLELDPVLGWRYRAGFGRLGDRINAAGLRSDHEYPVQPTAGVLRAEVFGDSFVYGNEVDTPEAWASVVEQRFPKIELMNFGVGGYGVDQAYLRFEREGMRFGPQVVMMGFVADDMRRLVNVYRRFISISELPLTKPRFTLGAGDSLLLIPNPVSSMTTYERLLATPKAVVDFGAHDQWYAPEVYENPLYDYSATVRLGTAAWQAVKRHILDPDRLQRGGTFNPDAAAFRIQVKLFERFSADVKRAGARPVILLFPDRESLHEHHRRGLPLIYAPLKDALQHRGIETVDLSRAFPVNADDHQIDSWFNPGGHYSPKGNAIIGQAVGEYLSHHVTLASVASASDKECARVSLNETQPPRLPASLDEARREKSGARALSA